MTERQIFAFLKSQGLSDAGAAGAMGNMFAESGLNSQNLQNSYEKKLGYTDASYTKAVDNGTYRNFASDKAGYGLCQWTYSTRKAALLAFAKTCGASIGDAEMQLKFFMKELREGYPTVLSVLKTATTVREASDAVLLKFERPADQSEAVRAKRAAHGQNYYDQFVKTIIGTGGVIMTEKELRAKVVSIAEKYLGCKESNGSHRKIIDLYNSHKPLARGYPVKYTDAWCATFVSAVFIEAGLTGIAPTECGCEAMINLYKKIGRWEENDAYVPDPGDIIMYDWQDNGIGDNTGAADHVGIVVSVSGSSIKIIEGNMSDAVGYRTLRVNGKYIRGYCLPKYAGKTNSAGSNTTVPPNNNSASKPTSAKKATEAARSFDKTLAGTYVVTANVGLHIRNGAGTSKASLTVLPKGAKVANYGYYTLVGNTKWLYVQVTYKGVTYTGFCSSQYLKK